MDRCEKALELHKKGFNCCQSVLAAFTDLTGLTEQASFDIGGGFGGGAGMGELCGAISGAVMTLGILTPADPNDPMGSKKQAGRLARELQKRFSGKFGALRCRDLLKNKTIPAGAAPAAQRLGVTDHCGIMVVTAVELVEELLAERAEKL
ncbi:C-GCAxxG-C-C family protein [uncultured Dysosmobacter sp.]|uniref:C-GCAxxG-C-C family protein n=1 Tax=uncultured Dysosmobacter sp. TaxID=2591384 RepID=UPI0026053DDF|nr:C-GCAxxG-C-C family protein [uncultured Dysosmobacter sp.]